MGRTRPTPNRAKPKTAERKSLGSRMSEGLSHLVGRERFLSVILGAILTIGALYLTYAFISYLATGGPDQSVVLGHFDRTPEELNPELKGRAGVAGSYLMHKLVNEWVGLGLVFLIYLMGAIGLKLLTVVRINYLRQTLLCTAATFWSALTLATITRGFADRLFFYPGGIVGEQMYQWLYVRVGYFGVLLAIFLLLFLLLFIFFRGVRSRFNNWADRRDQRRKEQDKKKLILPEMEEDPEITVDHQQVEEQPSPTPDPLLDRVQSIPEVEQQKVVSEGEKEVTLEVIDARHSEEEEAPKTASEALVEQLGPYDPKRDLSHYQMPGVDLLKNYEERNREIDQDEIQENKTLIINTLRSFGIDIKSIIATVGPAITLYEVVPEDGIHISRIRNLEDNISMSLSANGIRIIAPMPGKGTIGLEVPNKNPQIVSMRAVLGSRAFQESKAELPVALGRTITNDVFIFDLAKVPHLLVAGATGQGKSVGLNAVITSLLYKKHPSELKFVMIDPKMVEFSMYGKIEKHYMAKLPEEDQTIITDTKRAANTLNSLCQEMDDRYNLLTQAMVRNIKEYNEKFTNRQLNPEKGHRYLPYIVLIIDEYGDLIITAGKEIETPITRLAQKARAVGIHAIIATQRPTASIITGAIKANFPGRLAFRVTSAVDSRIILDAAGANRLVGRGDSLYSQGNDLVRVQCAFVDTPEVTDVVHFISDQRGYLSAYPLPEVDDPDAPSDKGALDPNMRDELFDEVAFRLVAEQKASASFIQQIFAIGYNRAARLMVQLEAAGIVGPQNGSKPREVLIKSNDQLDLLLNSNPDDN